LGVPFNAAYCSSKAAIGAITRCLAVEWAKKNIRVLNVAPGFVLTDLNSKYTQDEKFQNYLKRSIPVGRAAVPEEIASFIETLLKYNSNFLTGETIYIDGGQGIVS
jgi:NAD(P)-dependent dehydrogenase (short-subunit alcohol dehydrogenase family)